MTHGSLFSGIGGFDLGFERAGIKTVWAVEKEPFCRAVLKTHFPDTEIFNDVRDCGKHNLSAVDIISAGFPCQDLSVAGQRRGLAGNRSGLFYELARILGELAPAWFVLENVPGLFSSNNGWDFFHVIRSLDELGYGLAWRVLDSQHFRVAQRRRRVFIVGCLGRPCPPQVLFESEGCPGDFAESEAERKELASEIAASLRGVGGTPRGFNLDAEQGLAVAGPLGRGNDGIGRRTEDDPNLAYCLQNSAGTRRDGKDNLAYGFYPTGGGRAGEFENLAPTIKSASCDSGPAVASTLSSAMGHHGYANLRGDGTENLVTPPLVSRSSRGGKQNLSPGFTTDGHVVADTVTASYGKQIDSSDRNGGPPNVVYRMQAFGKFTDDEIAGPVKQRDFKSATDLVASGGVDIQRAVERNVLGERTVSDAQRDPAQRHQPPAVRDHAVAGTLGGRNRGDDLDRVGAFIGENGRGETRLNSVSRALSTGGGKPGLGYPAALCPETDSERVRAAPGFPAGLDSARYRALGNAVTVNVAEWIGRRILNAARSA